MESWDVVYRDDNINVIDYTCAFKIKLFIDELINNFKARFCARVDQQVECVYFVEKDSTVVQWTTIRLMLVLEVLLGLKTKHGDVTVDFFCADFYKGENIYVKAPRGFKQRVNNGKNKLLKLKKTLYGIRQIPRVLWEYLNDKLEACGLDQSKFWTLVICQR